MSYLRYLILLYTGDQQIAKLRTRKQGRVSYFLRNNTEWERAYLRVMYDEDKLNINEGWYDNLSDLHSAFRAFIEPELKEYLNGTTIFD